METTEQQTEVLHAFIERKGGDWYAARDMEHAYQLWMNDTGMERGEADFYQPPDDYPLTLDNDGVKETKTCAEWVREVGNPGAFAGEAR